MARIVIEVILRAVLRLHQRQQRSLARLEVGHLVLLPSSSFLLDLVEAAWKWRYQAGHGHGFEESKEALSMVLEGYPPSSWGCENE